MGATELRQATMRLYAPLRTLASIASMVNRMLRFCHRRIPKRLYDEIAS